MPPLSSFNLPEILNLIAEHLPSSRAAVSPGTGMAYSFPTYGNPSSSPATAPSSFTTLALPTFADSSATTARLAP